MKISTVPSKSIARYVAVAALCLCGAAIVGCAKKSSLELTPEQQAEVDQSHAHSKKRGWIDVPPMPATDVKAKATSNKTSEEDPYAGADLPASEKPPVE